MSTNKHEKNPAAVALGKLAAGKRKTVTPERRQQLAAIMRENQRARWKDHVKADQITNMVIASALTETGQASGLPEPDNTNAGGAQ
jgi:hypothetical protein